MTRQIITVLVLAIAVPYVLNQVRKPTRWVGRVFLWSMNRSHAALTDWALKHVRIGKRFAILDVGCGGGATIEKLAAAAPEGRVAGVDVSKGSVDASRAKNARSIQAGRVEIELAPVSHLPYPDGAFDLVTAVETHYYWPDLPNDLREVVRVLKPGGVVMVIAESYKGSRLDLLHRPAMGLLRAAYLSVEGHRRWFQEAGLADVQAFEERARAWMCVMGAKPPGRG